MTSKDEPLSVPTKRAVEIEAWLLTQVASLLNLRPEVVDAQTLLTIAIVFEWDCSVICSPV